MSSTQPEQHKQVCRTLHVPGLVGSCVLGPGATAGVFTAAMLFLTLALGDWFWDTLLSPDSAPVLTGLCLELLDLLSLRLMSPLPALLEFPDLNQ